jgi:undecaprenyl pyrophosphate synthase
MLTTISDWFRAAGSSIIRCGPVPKHVAIIMDGNRRFAKKMNVQYKRGHALGFEKLKQVCKANEPIFHDSRSMKFVDLLQC